jgi:hypothetical protein
VKNVAVYSREDDSAAGVTRLIIQVDDIDPALIGTLQRSQLLPFTIDHVVVDSDEIAATLGAAYPEYTVYLSYADRQRVIDQLLEAHGFTVPDGST